jgi:predicted transcriptional regulator
MIEGKQIRAARALLDWSRDELIAKSGVSPSALLRLEGGLADSRSSTLNKLINALTSEGIEFISQPDGSVGVLVRPK